MNFFTGLFCFFGFFGETSNLFHLDPRKSDFLNEFSITWGVWSFRDGFSQKVGPTSHIKHYGHYSQETWQNGNLLHGSSDHTCLSDLHPRSQSQGLRENLEKLNRHLKRWHFLKPYDDYSHETWHNGTLWQGSPDHTSLSDLHPRLQSQGLMKNLEKLKHCHLLRLYGQYNHETWHSGTSWQCSSTHTGFGDLHPRSKSQGLIENLETLKHLHFSKTLWPLQSWHLTPLCFMEMPFRPY